MLAIVLNCIDRLNDYNSAAHFAGFTREEHGTAWKEILNLLYKLLGKVFNSLLMQKAGYVFLHWTCFFTTKEYFKCYSCCHVNYRISSIYLMIFIAENRVSWTTIQKKNKSQLGKWLMKPAKVVFLVGFNLNVPVVCKQVWIIILKSRKTRKLSEAEEKPKSISWNL